MGLKFDRLVVFLDISDVSDESRLYRLLESDVVVDKGTQAGNDEETPAPAKPFTQQLKDLGSSNSILFVSVYKSYLRGLFPRPDAAVNRERSLWTVDPALYEEFGLDGLARSDRFMNELHQLLADNGIELTIAVYPWPNQLVQNDEASRQVFYWTDWAEPRGIQFINHFPTFFDQILRDGTA